MKLDRTVAAIERGLQQGLHVGAQLYVSLRGRVIADLAFGIARSGVASRSSIGYADPTHGLVVACIFNGAPEEAAHDARMREVNAAIYEDLSLV